MEANLQALNSATQRRPNPRSPEATRSVVKPELTAALWIEARAVIQYARHSDWLTWNKDCDAAFAALTETARGAATLPNMNRRFNFDGTFDL